MTGTIPVAVDGITPLPAGSLACIKTYLACKVPPATSAISLPPGITLTRLTGADLARYRTIFSTLGARWLWWSRALLTDAALATLLDDPAIHAHAIERGGREIGLFELDFRDQTAADLAFLGLYDEATGQGLGNALIAEAVARVAAQGANRLTVNTCTFDHPAALGFYRNAGFDVLHQAIEMVPDPRLTGVLPLSAAPHIPLARAQ